MRLSRLLSRPSLLLVLAMVLLAAGGRYAWHRFACEEKPTPDNFDLPPLSSSPFLNATGEAEDVGVRVCAECHLNADSAVIVRGRSLEEFRPGLPLTDFCVNYRLDEATSQMKVVGHVEQMHQSRCSRASEDLTCTTCHDPHSRNGPAQTRQQTRKVCLNCHGEAGCRLPATGG